MLIQRLEGNQWQHQQSMFMLRHLNFQAVKMRSTNFYQHTTWVLCGIAAIIVTPFSWQVGRWLIAATALFLLLTLLKQKITAKKAIAVSRRRFS